jgi:putative inorganic carbon (HCO3(-)) transporter
LVVTSQSWTMAPFTPGSAAHVQATSVAWCAVVIALCAAAGVLAGSAPVVFLATAAASVAAVAFAGWPIAILLAVVLVRPSLDKSGELLTIGGVNFAGILGVLVVLGGGLALIARARGLPAPRVVTLCWVALALMLATVAYSLDPSDGIRSWFTIAAPVVVFVVAAWAVREQRQFEHLMTAVLLSAVVPLVAGVVQLAAGVTVDKDVQGLDAIGSTFVHPNGYAFFLVVVLAVGVVAFARARNLAIRLTIGSGLVLGLASLILTYGRSAWLAAVAILLALAALEYRRLLVIAPIAAIVFGLALPGAADSIGARFSDLSDPIRRYSDNSFAWRLENWERMLPYAGDRPFTGYGLGSYLPLTDAEFGVFDYDFRGHGDSRSSQRVEAHNDFLKLTIELGFIGAALYVAMTLSIALAVWRARRVQAVKPYATAVAATVVALLVVTTVDNVKDYNAAFYVLFALAGAIVSLAHRRDGATAAARAQGRRARSRGAYAALRLARRPRAIG